MKIEPEFLIRFNTTNDFDDFEVVEAEDMTTQAAVIVHEITKITTTTRQGICDMIEITKIIEMIVYDYSEMAESGISPNSKVKSNSVRNIIASRVPQLLLVVLILIN